jgi:prevent-host-death family protein
MDVSVRQLKNQLSKYLRQVQSGEEIEILSHGKPVGRLLAPLPGTDKMEDEAVSRLKTLPGVRPGDGRKVSGSDRPISVPSGTSEEILHWVRGE